METHKNTVENTGKISGFTHIDFHEKQMLIDGTALTFPLSPADIEKLWGAPDKTAYKDNEYIKYVYSEYGAVFISHPDQTNYLKSRKVYIDEEHSITAVYLYFGNTVEPMIKEGKAELPDKPCIATVTLDGTKPCFFYDRANTGCFSLILWTPYGMPAEGIIEKLQYPLTVSFTPPQIHKPGSYKIKKCREEVLSFDNINFKLAVIQVLMYDLEVLEPYFDIYDFADQYTGREIDTESISIIKPALNFFAKLPVPKRMAEKVEEIYMDGGNEIYMNIIPQWDGEDGCFDLNEISLSELKQFPNLKKATVMSGSFETVKKVFDDAGIEVELL